ncbi:hypothetical protein A8F94_22205 [Bacillus sp. FJAT-27225]|uniref:hypothetical protein n=1 Tax=Bacillus sp. FJAT-27225 TaxID=1743144 RepID=UPI00080C23AF|nr:hypothetical protein [Bacillus sp. FJAT-27225]OCA81585.1 hypothetical protein A8F94_22205 [Bacillus sp. FJAT-27225]
MFKKFLVCLFFLGCLAIHVEAETNLPVELFDINKGQVVKSVQSTAEIQQEASKFLQEITGVYQKINPIPKEGFMIKIPLSPPNKVENQWFKGDTDEVIVVFPSFEAPFLMLFDNKNNVHIFTFKGDTSRLLELINYKRT